MNNVLYMEKYYMFGCASVLLCPCVFSDICDNKRSMVLITANKRACDRLIVMYLSN